MTPASLPAVVARGRWRRLALLVANGLGQAGAAIITALIVEHAFSRIAVSGGETGAGGVAALGAGLVAATVVAAWLRGRERVDAERLGQDYVHEVRMILFERLTASAARSLQRRSQGATVLRFVGDLTALRKWVSLGLARLVVAGTMITGAMVALAVLSPVMAGLVGVVVLLGVIASVALGSGMRGAARHARQRRSRLAANVHEQVGAVAVVQAFGQADRERRRVRRQSRRLRQAMIERPATPDGSGGSARGRPGRRPPPWSSPASPAGSNRGPSPPP